MNANTTVNFNITDLRAKDARLYKDVIVALGLGELSGDISLVSKSWFEIPEPVRNRLTDYLRTVNPNPDAHIQKAGEHKADCSCDQCFTARTRREIEAAQLVEKQNAPGRARLLEYIQQGLLDNQSNRDAFLKFIDEKFPGLTVIRPDHVNAFVASKRLELEWKTPEPTPPPAPEVAPVRMIETKDGPRPELPIDADEFTMRASSIEQLKDLSKRRGEGTSWRKGWHGSNVGGRQSQVI